MWTADRNFAVKYSLPQTGTIETIANAAKQRFAKSRVCIATYGGGRQVEVWAVRRSAEKLIATYSKRGG